MAPSPFYSAFIAFAAACGALVLGWQIGMNSVLLNVLKTQNRFQANDQYVALYGSLFYAGFLPSLFLMSVFGEKVGRKLPLLLSAVVTVIGVAISISSAGDDLMLLYIGRFLAGFGTGVLCMVTPMFVSEIATKEARGKLSTVNQLMITLGIIIATLYNTILFDTMDTSTNIIWRLMLGAPIVPAALLLAMLPFIPESPISLINRGYESEALRALCSHRQASAQDVATEFEEMKQVVSDSKKLGNASWSDIKEYSVMRRLIVTCFLQFFQQVTGINAILTYCGGMYESMGLTQSQQNWMSVVLFTVNFLGTFPAMFLTDRLGRSRLLQIGGLGMMGTFLGTSAIFIFDSTLNAAQNGVVVNSATGQYASIILTFVYILFFAATWGPIVWTYQSEVFPIRVRSKCAAIATVVNTLTCIMVMYTFPFVMAGFAQYVYLPFVLSTLTMSVFAFFWTPETKGLGIAQIDALFARK